MFQVRRGEETTNRTFRFPKPLMNKMSVIAQKENVSLNSFVVQCCEYAMEHFQASDTETEKSKA